MANRIKKKEETKSSYQDNVALIMGVFTLAVLCVLPLVFRDYYFNILETKYQFYCIVSIAALVVMGGYGLVSGKMIEWFSKFDFKTWREGMSVGDWAMIAFWLANVISWTLSKDWKWEAFWGTSGRYNGVFLMTIYMAVYFLVTRFFKLKRWYLDAFLAVGIFVCVFGITDYFQMDVLGFKVNMMDTQKSSYTSTFGNINTYTIYVAALMAISMILFTQEKNQKRMMWYYGNMILSVFALIMGNSDNAYLSLAALLGLSPLWLFKTKTGIRKYMISLASFFTVIWCIEWINNAYVSSVLGISSVFDLIAGHKFLPVLIAVLWIISGVLVFLDKKRKVSRTYTEETNKILIYIWIAVIVVVCAAAAFVLYDANVAGHADKYSAISNYVVFNDAWGTNRGYIWKRAMEIFTDKLTPVQKIFGYGADTFALIMQYYFPPAQSGGTITIYDSAHNEYLHYLITIGLFGTGSYIAFMLASVAAMVRKMKEQPEVMAIMIAVLAYMIQAVVNINLPIAMPIIIQLLAMGVGRKKIPAEETKTEK